MTQLEKQQLLNEQYNIILDREAKLRSYDYIGVKIAMGVANKSDYAEQIAETVVWRADINAAQDEIVRLEAIEVEEPEPMEEVEPAEEEAPMPEDMPELLEEELSNN